MRGTKQQKANTQEALSTGEGKTKNQEKYRLRLWQS